MFLKRLSMDPAFFDRVFAPIAILVALTAWAASFSVGKVLLQHIDVLTLSFLRIFVACLLTLPYLIKHYKPIAKQDWGKLVLFAVLAMPATFLLQFYGLQHTSASIASLAIGLEAPMTMLWLYILFRHKPVPMNILITVMAVVGLALVVGKPEWGNIIGVLLVLAAGAAFALGVIISKDLFNSYGAVYISVWMFAIASVVSGVIWALFSPIKIMEITTIGWYGILYLGVVATLFAQTVWNWGVARVSAVRASQFVAWEPLLGAIMAVYWLDDYWYWGTVVGGLLISGSIVINALFEDEDKQKKSNENVS